MKRRLYYKQNGIIVRDMIKDDVDYLKDNLRDTDKEEVWASHHFTPEEALRESFERSLISMTILNGSPLGAFGINPQSLTGNSATIWFLATHGLDNIKIRFLKNSRHFINHFLSFYPYLHNYIDERNEKTISWLKFLGAKIDEKGTPYGKDGKKFRYFYFRRD